MLWFDNVDRVVSGINKSIARLDALTERHANKFAKFADRTEIHLKASQRANRVATKLKALVE